MITTRRGFFGLLAAPAIIRVADMMAVRAIVLGAIILPWGSKLVHDGRDWLANDNGVMVPIGKRDIVLGGRPIAPEYRVELSNYAQAGATMHISGPDRVEIGHVGLLDQFGRALR